MESVNDRKYEKGIPNLNYQINVENYIYVEDSNILDTIQRFISKLIN